MTWGHKQILGGGTKSLILRIRECGPKKGLYLKICADFHNFWGEDKKKLFISKKCANFHELRGETTKKGVFITKSAKKQFLLTNSRVITCILGVSGLELHFSGTKPVTYFGHNPRLGGTILVWGAHAVIWGSTVPECLRQVYSNLSNCNYHIFVKEILLEIGFIEEMRTI